MGNKSIIKVIFIWAITAIIGITILLPVYWVFLSSITPKEMLFTTPIHYIPLKPTVENYISLFKEVPVGKMAWQTSVIIFFSMLFSLLFSVIAAYSFVRFYAKGLRAALAFLVFSAMLPMASTIIPMFQFFKSLKMVDTFPGLIILYTSEFIPFTVMVFVTFISQIPKSLEEAADVDGATTLRKIFSILLPVLKPAIATMAIINFIQSMNEFMIPLIFTTSKINTLSVGITMIPRINQYNVPWEKISSLATIMLLPIVIFVVIFEKNIMEGLLAGSIKQ